MGGVAMAVEHYGEMFRCEKCGNKVEVIEVGGGTLACCGKEMQSIDDSTESTVNLPDSGGQ
jgi:desulfoferrodoxin-like iron-binding protein